MTRQGDRLPHITPETTPLYPTSVYTFPSLEAVSEYFDENPEQRYLYRRNGHPNQLPVEERLALLEHADAATLSSSGMAAIAQACFAHLKPGDEVLATPHLYGGTYAFFEQVLRPWGVNVKYVNLEDETARSRALSEHTALLYGETIANPLLQVMDLEAVGMFARQSGIPLFVDNTFATPWLVQPAAFGATLSIHSLTKFLNGHSDVLGGAVTGDAKAVQAVSKFAVTFGATMAPFDAWMTERGLQTFHVRMAAHCTNAARVAEFLSEHPAVKSVFYPGLPQHPDHEVAKRIFKNGFGSMVSFEVNGGFAGADALVRRLEQIHFAPSLGGVHTTVSHPGLTSHRAYSVEERRQLGISDGLIRLSVGIEPTDIILSDLGRALQ